jgi:hypothetical protein
MKIHQTLLAAVVAATAISAHGQLFVVDTGTPSQTGNTSVFYVDPTFGQILAQQFTLATATDVNHIDVFIGGFGTMNVQLTTAIGPATLPENVLASFDLSAPGTSGSLGQWRGADTSLSLNSGTYFLVFSGDGNLPKVPPTNVGPSFFAGQGDGDLNAAFPPGSSFLTLGVTSQIGIRISEVAPVPEPAETAAAMAVGLAGFAMAWRRFRKA